MAVALLLAEMACEPLRERTGCLARGIIPTLDLAFERSIGPEMMAMRSDVQPVGRRLDAFRKEPLEAHMSVRRSQSNGKARLSSVVLRSILLLKTCRASTRQELGREPGKS